MNSSSFSVSQAKVEDCGEMSPARVQTTPAQTPLPHTQLMLTGGQLAGVRRTFSLYILSLMRVDCAPYVSSLALDLLPFIHFFFSPHLSLSVSLSLSVFSS